MGKTENTENPLLEVIGLELPLLGTASKRLRKPRIVEPTEPPLFTQKHYEMMANAIPIVSATEAYTKQPEWHEYSPGKIYFQKRFGKERYIEFYILNKQKQQPEFISNSAEQEILYRYGVMAARLHAIFATYAARQKRPWNEPFSLLGTDLIKILRLNRRKDMTKPEKLKCIAELTWIVGTLGIAIHWREGKLDLHTTRKSPIWTVLYIEEYYQPGIPGIKDDKELFEVVIRIQPGAWTEKFLNKTGSKVGLALHQYGFIYDKFFDLNPYSQKLAVVTALYILQNQDAHPNGRYHILTLLKAILPSTEIETIRRDRKKRSRFIKQFHKLLLALVDADFHVEFSSSYPEELRPVWATSPLESSISPCEDNAFEIRATSNCFEAWLNSIVKITPPSFSSNTISSNTISELKKEETKIVKATKATSEKQLQKLSQSNQKISDNHTQTQDFSTNELEVTGIMVQQARKSLGLTQAYVASLVGKSVSWVKLIETGRRKIQPKEQEILRSVLKLEENP